MQVILLSSFIALLSCAVSTNQDHVALELLDIQPEFLDTPRSYNVEVGKNATLECSIRNLSDRQVIWRKVSEETPLTVGEETFHNTNRIKIEHWPNSPYWNLVIKEVQFNDSGVYECQVSSQYRHLRFHVLLTVIAATVTTSTPVENSIQIYGSQYVEKDRVILLTCNATGHEYVPEQLDWFYQGNKMVNDDPPGRISIKTNNSIQMKSISSILRIRGAQIYDSGMYLCRTTSLQIESFRVQVISADSHNVKRGTVEDDADEEAYQQRNSTHSPVLHRHLLTSILLLLALLRSHVFTTV